MAILSDDVNIFQKLDIQRLPHSFKNAPPSCDIIKYKLYTLLYQSGFYERVNYQDETKGMSS